jgi:hypothetical protein
LAHFFEWPKLERLVQKTTIGKSFSPSKKRLPERSKNKIFSGSLTQKKTNLEPEPWGVLN